MQRKIRHQTSLPSDLQQSGRSRHIRLITNIINDCWQNSRRWQCVHIHQGRCQGIQRRGCVNNIPKKTYYHRQTIWMGLIPHTINPGSRVMETKKNNKEIQEVYSTGQYCIIPSIYRRIHQVDACGLQISSQIHMYQGHQIRELRRIANAEWTQRVKILPRDHQDTKGTSESIKENFQVHQT